MLQAYIDDSGNVGDGKTSLLAGYLATAEVWADFSDRWSAELQAPPSIEYFKLSEALHLKDQFAGWSAAQRDDKVGALISVINATDVRYWAVAVLHNDIYLRVVKNRTRSSINDPFYFLFTQIIQACMIHQQNNNITDAIDFVFDQNSKPARRTNKVFSGMMFAAPDSIKQSGLIRNPPIMRDDKEFPPLQAADLLVGILRAQYENEELDAPRTLALNRLSSPGFVGIRREPTEADLRFVVDNTRMTEQYLRAASSPEEQLQRFLSVRAYAEYLIAEELARREQGP